MHLTNLFLKQESFVQFQAGQTIFAEGEVGESMFVLFEGMVEVYVSNKLIGTFEPIEVFGEMAVIAPGPRSATVVAKTDCRLAAVTQKRFNLLLSHHPDFALHMMGMLVERIRWMNEAARADGARHLEVETRLTSRVEELEKTVHAQAAEIAELKGEHGDAIHEELELAVG